MRIQVFGTGCKKCETLYQNAEQAARELELTFDLVKVSELDEIIEMGIMITPALGVNGEVVSTGKALSTEEIKDILQNK